MRNLNLYIASALVVIPTLGSAQTFANHTFFNGNDGSYTTGYTYVTGANSAYPEGTYTIGTNPNAVHDLWSSIPLSENAMIVNGSVDSNTTVWSEYLSNPLAAGDYVFKFDLANVYPTSVATLDVYINGVDQMVSLSNTGSALDSFQTMDVDFHSTGLSTPLNFRLVDTNTAPSGNDFAISNMRVESVPEPTPLVLLGLGLGAIILRRKS